MKGFVVIDYVKEFPKAYKELMALVGQGKIKVRIDLRSGIDECPNALMGLLKG